LKITRKEFLELTGLSVLAAGAMHAVHAVKAEEAARPSTAQADPPKKQMALAIDLRKCRQRPGCNLCSLACHTTHNVPQFTDPRHEVKWIWNETFAEVFPLDQNGYTRRNYTGSPLPILCNHCDHPPCVEVCPTGATWKRPEDGVVMMDWHRCIGCKYCITACPYDARSFNFSDPRKALPRINPDFPTRTLGVVEKCDFCAERLAKGEPPACVEACPEKAIFFGDVLDASSEISIALEESYSIRRKPELGTGPNVFYFL
jgi:molybdopterin-containing oxidoreductase family iron-sulfur binding subunit